MDGETPRLRVTFHGSSDVIREMEVPVASPDPMMTTFTVNDGNDGVLDPGETATHYRDCTERRSC